MEHLATKEWQRDGHRVIQCSVCGYCHIYPFPSGAELENFYRESYHREKWRFPYDSINAEFIAKQYQFLRQNRDNQRIYRRVTECLAVKAPRAMLDVGCGNNLLARFFMDQGWKCLVIEPNREAANYLRLFELEVVESMFDQMDTNRLGVFSFVNIQFVLEHVLNPLEILQKITLFLAPGGLIRICVPNDFSPGQMAWLATNDLDPPWISYPDHVNYFSFDSIEHLLKRSGFVQLSRSTNFPLEFLLLTGTDYYSDKSMRQRVNPAVTGFENAWIASGQSQHLDLLYEKLADSGMGRSVIIYARLA